MGWNPQEGYYQVHVKKPGCKITDLQEKINKLDPRDIASGINIVGQSKEIKNETKDDEVER